MSFPLYDRLSKNINDKDLTIKQKKFFLETIKTVDSNSKELFYVLIKYDSMQNNLPSMNIQCHIYCYLGYYFYTVLPNVLILFLYYFLSYRSCFCFNFYK